MRRVAHIMGMPISIDIPAAANEQPFEAAFAALRSIDERYSPYKPASEYSRYAQGKLTETDLSDEMQQVKQACETWQTATDDYFSAYFNGKFDPTGYVKGWAIQQAADALEALGYTTYLINASGDILARSTTDHTWRIALQHPRDKQSSFGTISARNLAVATSGSYERGQHILDPHTKQPATSVLSCTVIGPDIIAADVYATALCAMGIPKGLDFINRQPSYEALLVAPDLQAFPSEHFTSP